MNIKIQIKKFFNPLIKWCINEKKETSILLRNIPSTIVSLFVVSIICMNLLANKTLFQSYWIALDGGILISWLSFMCMDIITKYFGPKASNKIAILASIINLLTCLIFYIATIIPSQANDYTAFDEIFGNTWFIILGSTISFLISAIINNFLNWYIGKTFFKNPNGKLAYATQTYISTFVGQFFDNFIFSIIVFVIFAPIFWNGFHWTVLQSLTCAFTGSILELFIEIIFSPFGYHILTQWKNNNIGIEYLSLRKEKI